MFRSARIQLTLWYLLIIMLVSASFSLVIYKVLGNEVERFARVQRFRLERVSPDLVVRTPIDSVPDLELIEETKRRLAWVLVGINLSILVISGGLGYLLADRTLHPIQEMVDEQHRFISDASHELKTPLTSLKSAFEVYLRDTHRTKKDADEVIQESILEVDKLHNLSESLLQLARYQEPNYQTAFEKIELQRVLTIAQKKVAPLAKQRHIEIQANSTDAIILGNSESLVSIFVILLDNAIKYSPNKSLIQIKVITTKKTVRVSITDQGIGIDSKDLSHIFDRFYRADQARTKTQSNGYGLGLSIAQNLTQIHHGNISVSSLEGKGSTFTLQFPRTHT